jgi:hypothetical protein
MELKLMSLRYDGTCSVCDGATPARSKAWWDKAAKQVTCLSCRPAQTAPAAAIDAHRTDSTPAAHPGSITAPLGTPLPPPPAIDNGVGGVSATKEYERRRATHERAIEAKWGTGRIGRFVKFISDEPQSTVAWAKGAEGERRLARRLNDDLADVAVVLQDRKVPKTRGNIDHLVVSSSGIWIIDAKNYAGKVEQRDVGGWFSTDLRLYVGNRNQTRLVDGLAWQVEAVRAVLAPIGFGEAPVHPSLCFISSEWGWFAKPIRMNGVLVTWAGKLVEVIREPGPLDATTIDLLARELSNRLPASR